MLNDPLGLADPMGHFPSSFSEVYDCVLSGWNAVVQAATQSGAFVSGEYNSAVGLWNAAFERPTATGMRLAARSASEARVGTSTWGQSAAQAQSTTSSLTGVGDDLAAC